MFKVDIDVGNMDGGDLAPVRPIVDTGAAHSMLPESLLTRLNIAARRQLSFILADGSRVFNGFGLARLSINGQEWPCPVIFGPEGNHPLGATTLEISNPVVDPTGEPLLPAEWLSLGWGGGM